MEKEQILLCAKRQKDYVLTENKTSLPCFRGQFNADHFNKCNIIVIKLVDVLVLKFCDVEIWMRD